MRPCGAWAVADALLDPAVTQRVLERVREAGRQEQAASFKDLTGTGAQGLGLVSQGHTNKEIAKELFSARARSVITSAASCRSWI